VAPELSPTKIRSHDSSSPSQSDSRSGPLELLSACKTVTGAETLHQSAFKMSATLNWRTISYLLLPEGVTRSNDVTM
jgi:hypothetical protein